MSTPLTIEWWNDFGAAQLRSMAHDVLTSRRSYAEQLEALARAHGIGALHLSPRELSDAYNALAKNR
jgi:hypothetical protein